MNRYILAGVAALSLTAAAIPASAAVTTGDAPMVKVQVCRPVTQFRLEKGDVVYSIKSGNPVRQKSSYDCPEVTVYFEFDQTAIRPEFSAELDKAAGLLAKGKATVYVTGHTDSVGRPGYNDGLSEARASAVASYLAAKGVAPEKMVVSGMSENGPVGDNTSADGRALNRRADVSTVAPAAAPMGDSGHAVNPQHLPRANGM